MVSLLSARRSWLALLTLATLVFAAPARGQEAEKPQDGPKLNWTLGPAKGQLGDQAEIEIPKDYKFLDAAETQAVLRAFGNPTSGRELGLLAPVDKADPNEMKWLMVFEFNSVGYVKDDEKDKLDADAILASIREGTEDSNEERKRLGGAPMHITGWQEKPNYDPQTNNLQWAIKGESEGRPAPDNQIVNYNTRMLGRSGVMEVTLIASPAELASVTPIYKQLLTGFVYTQGNKYGEFKSGDKVAEYGLTALVAGGGLAVAAKTGLLAKFFGLFAKLGKAAILIVIGALAAVKAFFSKIFGGKQTEA